MDVSAGPITVAHSTFSVERTYPCPISRVFGAFSDPSVKRRWLVEGEGWEIDEFTLDFRVGGRETSRLRSRGGAQMRNDTIFLDIVPGRRIVFAYTMTAEEKRISVSLGTVELEETVDGTRLVYTEQGAFLDGLDGAAQRRGGWGGLLDRLGKELGRGSVGRDL